MRRWAPTLEFPCGFSLLLICGFCPTSIGRLFFGLSREPDSLEVAEREEMVFERGSSDLRPRTIATRSPLSDPTTTVAGLAAGALASVAPLPAPFGVAALFLAIAAELPPAPAFEPATRGK